MRPITVKVGLCSITLLAVLAACTHGGGSGTSSSAPASLTVAQSYDPGPRGPVFIEGALGEVVLVGPDGVRQTKQGHVAGRLTFFGLKPGRYVIRPALRPCSANCGNLSGRAGECEASVEVAQATIVYVRYGPEGPCSVFHG